MLKQFLGLFGMLANQIVQLERIGPPVVEFILLGTVTSAPERTSTFPLSFQFGGLPAGVAALARAVIERRFISSVSISFLSQWMYDQSLVMSDHDMP